MVRSGRPSEGLRRLANRPIGRSLSAGQGFGERSTPPEPDKTTRGPGSDPNVEGAPVKRAKSLMPLADAASKLLPKQNADGSVQFNNPGVGDFQVLDSLVEVSLCSVHSHPEGVECGLSPPFCFLEL